MGKLEITQTTDCYGVACMVIKKKNGNLTRREVYEELVKEGLFGNYLMDMNIHEEYPEELYEEGDSWGLYEPEALLGEKAEQKYNEGYDDCYHDQLPDAEWMGRICSCCGSHAPAKPNDGTNWLSPRCPSCGAVMKNGGD